MSIPHVCDFNCNCQSSTTGSAWCCDNAFCPCKDTPPAPQTTGSAQESLVREYNFVHPDNPLPTPPAPQTETVTLTRETLDKLNAVLMASVSALKTIALYNVGARKEWRLPDNIMQMVADVQHRLDEVNFNEL